MRVRLFFQVRIDVHGARLIARVDSNQEEVYLKGLNHDTNYGVSTNLPSVVLVGGKCISCINYPTIQYSHRTEIKKQIEALYLNTYSPLS